MTPFEQYQQFLAQYTAPQQGIQSILPVPSLGNNGGDTTSATTSTNTTSMGIGNIGLSDIGKAIGFAMNPALGIANMVATNVLGRSPMDMAMNAMGFGENAGGASNGTGSVDTGDMGSEAANDAANAAASQSASGGASSSDGGSTGGCGSFKDGGKITGASARPNFNLGGRIGYAEGSRDFPEFKEWMRGNQQGGIMELLDEYNRQKEQYQYSKKYPRDEAANGGRIGYLQGGLVSLLGDYYGKR